MQQATNAYWIRYNRLTSEINALYHELAVKQGMADSVQCILYVLCERGGQCLQSDLFHASGLRRQTIHSALRNMEAEQLVQITPGTGRNTVVCLTEQGQQFCARKILPIFQMENRIADTWKPEERRLYLELTQQYLSALREAVHGA